MGANTRIEYCDDTWSPWWGCTKVSTGCTNCWAERWAKRFTTAQLWGPKGERQVMGERYWGAPHRWAAQATLDRRRRRVFCGSMCDVLEDHPQLSDLRRDLWDLIEKTPELDWLLLTKRPENIGRMIPWAHGAWPLNVWMGTSIEDQAAADLRIPELLKWPAAVLWLSAEPLLGPINLGLDGMALKDWGQGYRPVGEVLSWCIIGGESGPRCRPMRLDWARDLRDQCREAGVAFFFKQTGGHPDKGTDLARHPEDLRIREIPSPVIGREMA